MMGSVPTYLRGRGEKAGGGRGRGGGSFRGRRRRKPGVNHGKGSGVCLRRAILIRRDVRVRRESRREAQKEEARRGWREQATARRCALHRAPILGAGHADGLVAVLAEGGVGPPHAVGRRVEVVDGPLLPARASRTHRERVWRMGTGQRCHARTCRPRVREVSARSQERHREMRICGGKHVQGSPRGGSSPSLRPSLSLSLSLSLPLSLTRARARARRTHPPSVGLVLRTRLTMPFATRSFLPLAFSTTSATVRLTTGLNP